MINKITMIIITDKINILNMSTKSAICTMYVMYTIYAIAYIRDIDDIHDIDNMIIGHMTQSLVTVGIEFVSHPGGTCFTLDSEYSECAYWLITVCCSVLAHFSIINYYKKVRLVILAHFSI